MSFTAADNNTAVASLRSPIAQCRVRSSMLSSIALSPGISEIQINHGFVYPNFSIRHPAFPSRFPAESPSVCLPCICTPLTESLPMRPPDKPFVSTIVVETQKMNAPAELTNSNAGTMARIRAGKRARTSSAQDGAEAPAASTRGGVSHGIGGLGTGFLGRSGGDGLGLGLLIGLLVASIRQVEAYPGDSDPWWVFATMPFISGIVGYGTNVLALKMTFYPVEFMGIKIWQPEDQPLGCIGWQGIVPAKAAKMAHKSVTLMTEKLINIKDVFSRLDPDEMCEALEPGLLAVVSRVVTEVAANHMPGTWKFLPESSRDDIVLKALEDVPIFMRSFMGEVKTGIDDVLDVHDMVVTNLVKNKSLMNRVFMEVGAKELVFIERSGLFFGFLFGCLQTCLWYFYQEDWVLPAGGLVVGWLTNYLALNMIFRPINERIVCGVKVQGLFLKRQTEVAAQFAEITSNEILTSQAMWEAILTGPKKDNFNAMCKRHTHQFVDLMAGSLRPLVQHMIGEKEFVALKDEIAQQMIENLPVAIRFGHTYTTKALDMSNTIRTAMQGLSPAEFEGVLHPVFEEDEWKLILVGGALGALVGVFQLYVLF